MKFPLPYIDRVIRKGRGDSADQNVVELQALLADSSS